MQANQGNVLIVGGTSGLGLEMAQLFSKDYNVRVTGRRDPSIKNIRFNRLDLTAPLLTRCIYKYVTDLPYIHTLVYAAGFFQEGTIDELSGGDIDDMISVGLRAPALFLQQLLNKQGGLAGFIAITSTSQSTPRKLELVYGAVKAGLGQLANSLAEDDRVGKVLVFAPGGMKTRFWEHDGRDTSGFMDPKRVAEDAVDQWQQGDFRYKSVRKERESPLRILEVR